MIGLHGESPQEEGKASLRALIPEYLSRRKGLNTVIRRGNLIGQMLRNERGNVTLFHL